MKIISQITVFLENQPGTMAKICKLIRDQGLNIHAFTVFGTVDHGVLRLVVDKTEKIISILTGKGFLAIQSDVIEIPVANNPGTLHDISSLLADNGVNIEYGYGSTGQSSREERLYLQASDNQQAIRVLRKKYPLEGDL